ncbi:MAG: non-heme iron oxygenase ferredoxin subunit [Nevskia sp.]|nr:non-heme iron oxygenase ferredoxin subunit [Nevskia sp.]
MPNTLVVCPAGDVPSGTIRLAVLPDGRRLALYNVGGTFYATDDTCTHEQASLAEEGMLEGSLVACGWHFCTFDVTSGAACSAPCHEPLKTYPVSVVDGMVRLEY